MIACLGGETKLPPKTRVSAARTKRASIYSVHSSAFLFTWRSPSHLLVLNNERSSNEFRVRGIWLELSYTHSQSPLSLSLSQRLL